MHIGLIGGIGPAATDFYYCRIIAAFAARTLPSTSVSLTTYSPPVPIASSSPPSEVTFASALSKKSPRYPSLLTSFIIVVSRAVAVRG